MVTTIRERPDDGSSKGLRIAGKPLQDCMTLQLSHLRAHRNVKLKSHSVPTFVYKYRPSVLLENTYL